MDLFEDDAPEAGDNAHEFTVSEISGAVKKTIEGEFGHVRVRGEVGRVTVARTGHMYFDLKDDRSVLAAVSWKGQVAKLSHRPEEGMEVIATGRMTTFGPQSRYQLNVEEVVPAGAGALMAMLEKRRQALAAEGLFDAARKRPLPYLPEIIGVVTSPTGAVIRDILHRLRDRFPRKVLVWPVAVQGKSSAAEVAAAIRGFNAMSPGGALPRPDLLIVARGGGSIEDLWGFNEEIVVRAAAESAIPLISAVGHETDTTLIDHASDRRAPTPTAAAEIAVPVRAELQAVLAQFGARLGQCTHAGLDRRAERLRDLSRALPRPEALLMAPAQRLDALETRLPGALRAAIAKKRIELSDHPLRPGLVTRAVERSRDRLEAAAGRLPGAHRAGLAQKRLRLEGLRLNPAALDAALRRERRDFERLAARLRPDLVTTRLERQRERLAALERLRVTLGYEATLARGYAVVRGDGHVVTNLSEAQAATALEIEFRDGRLQVGQGAKPKRATKPVTPPEQGTLL
ncbi:exodeoxyribonuclease VII large subunit [Limimaricola soesokkakensis]|uniref:Exodeoxyribonuclease 7 large subunit n=1 Tax=Limimaricola soesokkakensis TaxID=1343159 RepID=A0A1X6YB02_9RHOB|nr:exodeoxyribonuclease VII large subunit [Limimaricola soesokkakensis]PSK87165.1 exodeoxyribonuclease VII large subunit [Limimaricola soesokkakensis]SLN15191.1 Exodeoxyribonuclease 7 large subunit [Limimaricola soesokkakensis]